MKEEAKTKFTVFATQEPPIAAQDELGTLASTDQPFSNARLAFVRQGMRKLEASLVEKVGAHTREAITYTV